MSGKMIRLHFMLITCLTGAPALAENLDNRAGVRAATIEAAAANAHFGAKFCGLSSAKASAYKVKVKAHVGTPDDFDVSWTRGWKREEETIVGYEKLRAENPTLFASDVADACAELITLPR
jgi:hypothetical protein